MKNLVNSNCSKCKEYTGEDCVGKEGMCICKECPRNIAKCIITRWCSETESMLEF